MCRRRRRKQQEDTTPFNQADIDAALAAERAKAAEEATAAAEKQDQADANLGTVQASDTAAANMTGLARATEYEKPCLAIAQPFFLQCFVPTLWNGDALQQVAPLADLQCCSGEFANLTFGELTRSSTGMNASHEQNLTAEVVAQSRQKSLVKIHRVQCPARKHFTLQSISDLPPCEIGAQNVWAYALEEGMLINKFRVPNTDIRCTVEEGTVAVGM